MRRPAIDQPFKQQLADAPIIDGSLSPVSTENRNPIVETLGSNKHGGTNEPKAGQQYLSRGAFRPPLSPPLTWFLSSNSVWGNIRKRIFPTSDVITEKWFKFLVASSGKPLREFMSNYDKTCPLGCEVEDLRTSVEDHAAAVARYQVTMLVIQWLVAVVWLAFLVYTTYYTFGHYYRPISARFHRYWQSPESYVTHSAGYLGLSFISAHVFQRWYRSAMVWWPNFGTTVKVAVVLPTVLLLQTALLAWFMIPLVAKHAYRPHLEDLFVLQQGVEGAVLLGLYISIYSGIAWLILAIASFAALQACLFYRRCTHPQSVLVTSLVTLLYLIHDDLGWNETIRQKSFVMLELEEAAGCIEYGIPRLYRYGDEDVAAWSRRRFRLSANALRELKMGVTAPNDDTKRWMVKRLENTLAVTLSEQWDLFETVDFQDLKSYPIGADISKPMDIGFAAGIGLLIVGLTFAISRLHVPMAASAYLIGPLYAVVSWLITKDPSLSLKMENLNQLKDALLAPAKK